MLHFFISLFQYSEIAKNPYLLLMMQDKTLIFEKGKDYLKQ